MYRTVWERSERVFVAHTGISKSLFDFVFDGYCGPNTPILSRFGCLIAQILHTLLVASHVISLVARFCLGRAKLFNLLHFLKVYPSYDVVSVFCGKQSAATYHQSVKVHMRHLAQSMGHIIQDTWNERGAGVPKDISQVFGKNLVGIVDSFPVYVRRPRSNKLNGLLYSGKYKSCVVKFNLVVNFCGVPLLIDGPHIGSRHDARLWKEHIMNRLSEIDKVLGDRGYQGCPKVESQVKRAAGKELDDLDVDYNVVHGYLFAVGGAGY
jgi:DDE superfamily endonuclease